MAIFQIIDRDCPLIYHNSKFYKNLQPHFNQTWSYSPALKNVNVECAKLYCGGQTLDKVCPPGLQEEWENINNRLKAYYRSMREVGLDLKEHCFYDLVPKDFVKDYCEIKNKLTNYVITNYNRPSNYEFLLSLARVVSDIEQQDLNIDASSLAGELHRLKTRRFVKKLKEIKPRVSYNVFGSKTGRLTGKKDYFPILTLAKEHRAILSPKNDWFVEFDYNAMELRTALALLGQKQPKEDLHAWNIKNVYKNSLTREKAKERIFAWLYNPAAKDHLSDRMYKRDVIKQKYWDGKKITTMFGNALVVEDQLVGKKKKIMHKLPIQNTNN